MKYVSLDIFFFVLFLNFQTQKTACPKYIQDLFQKGIYSWKHFFSGAVFVFMFLMFKAQKTVTTWGGYMVGYWNDMSIKQSATGKTVQGNQGGSWHYTPTVFVLRHMCS